MTNPKICLIGYGYWGKILHKNLLNLSYTDVTIVDEVLGNAEKIGDNFDYYFVATPFTTHLSVLTKLSKFSNKKIWCEKPLASTFEEVQSIYKKIGSKNNKLFVDWVYLYNPAIHYIKETISGKRIKQIVLNRTNEGPVRTDCSSIWDLSSHDLSIIFQILGFDEREFNWYEFSLKTNEDFGSNLSWSYQKGTQIIINSSWQHQMKNRVSIFITEHDEIIIFDDIKKTVTLSNGEVQDFTEAESPLENAIKEFLGSEDFSYNRKMTEQITLQITNKTKKK